MNETNVVTLNFLDWKISEILKNFLRHQVYNRKAKNLFKGQIEKGMMFYQWCYYVNNGE